MKTSLYQLPLIGIFALVLCFTGCEEKDLYSSKDRDDADMSRLRIEINKLAVGQAICDDNAEWKFTTLESKSCNGIEYIAYSTKTSEDFLLKKISFYNQKMKAYRMKWNSIYSCKISPIPKSIECINNKPTFVY